jgi:leader peptidase (prepilin peptidase)/N-methyltransferase
MQGHVQQAIAACPRRALAVAVAGLAAAGLAAAVLGVTLRGLVATVLVLALIPVVAMDIERRLIPDAVVLPATAFALALGIAAEPGRWWLRPLAAAGAGGLLLVLWAVHPEGMGLGDVKLAALLGAALGASVVPALAVAFGAGGLTAAWLLVARGRRGLRTAVPFAPYLAGGALIGLAWGPGLLAWCMNGG